MKVRGTVSDQVVKVESWDVKCHLDSRTVLELKLLSERVGASVLPWFNSKHEKTDESPKTLRQGLLLFLSVGKPGKKQSTSF